MSAFEREWTEFHGKAPPLAFALREVSEKPWVRFHALPDGVRYSTSQIEREEVRQRASILGDQLLGNGDPCWLVQCQVEEYIKPNWKPLTPHFGPQLRYRDKDDDFHWMAFASPVRWEAKEFYDLLFDIADDRTGPTLWFSRQTGKVFGPYDGGFDLFPTTQTEVIELRQRYSGWLSMEPSAL
jgi:hypothetical protein